MKTLRDWLPYEALNDSVYVNEANRFRPHLDKKVIAEYGVGSSLSFIRWPGTHKNVHNWCILESHLAVGWNESPARGWGFPSMKLIDQKLYRVAVYDDPKSFHAETGSYLMENQIPRYVDRNQNLSNDPTEDTLHTYAGTMEVLKRFPNGDRFPAGLTNYITFKGRPVTVVDHAQNR